MLSDLTVLSLRRKSAYLARIFDTYRARRQNWATLFCPHHQRVGIEQQKLWVVHSELSHTISLSPVQYNCMYVLFYKSGSTLPLGRKELAKDPELVMSISWFRNKAPNHNDTCAALRLPSIFVGKLRSKHRDMGNAGSKHDLLERDFERRLPITCSGHFRFTGIIKRSWLISFDPCRYILLW